MQLRFLARCLVAKPHKRFALFFRFFSSLLVSKAAQGGSTVANFSTEAKMTRSDAKLLFPGASFSLEILV